MGRRYTLVFFRVNFSFCLRVVAMSLVLTLPPFSTLPGLFFFTVQTSVYVNSAFSYWRNFAQNLKCKPNPKNEMILKVSQSPKLRKLVKIAKSPNFGFQCVAKINKRMVPRFVSQFGFIAIFWLNLPQEDYHFSYK
jgi:hypothetical protein